MEALLKAKVGGCLSSPANIDPPINSRSVVRLVGKFYCKAYILLMITRTMMVKMQVATIILNLPKNERMVIARSANAQDNAPIKKGFKSVKVNGAAA